MSSPRGQEEHAAVSGSSTLATPPNVIADNLRQFTRSPHPYHRSRRVVSRTPSEQGDRLHPYSYSKSSRTPSDSGTEADDESTGILRGLPAPPLRPRKGLRSGGNGIVDTDGWLPNLQPWPSFVRQNSRGSRRSSEEEAEGDAIEARKQQQRNMRIEVLRRLLETVILLSVGGVVLLQREARSLAWNWRKGMTTIRDKCLMHLAN
ncbi:hypothetical protein N7492_004329 [Penicillium capsulatum]|uniref:Uncharacterized protein n=1 Tax=Penicillium capsulatum TaxID=69766 RepID=A0A9W9IA14_9EURO|nr:hypothetical protein N7492_004329 [Penicillium capsulatum]KAJ6136553.1 hypothetical protein N7512_001713 [Penicillium capsulatum]